jgi:hypothetical protein
MPVYPHPERANSSLEPTRAARVVCDGCYKCASLLLRRSFLHSASGSVHRWPPTLGRSILKGWRHSAQGCEGRATLGNCREEPPTLKGLHPPGQQRASAQALDATLSGLRAGRHGRPRVARSSQPRAERWNPVGIRKVSGGNPKRNLNPRPTRSLQTTPGDSCLFSVAQPPGAPELWRCAKIENNVSSGIIVGRD